MDLGLFCSFQAKLSFSKYSSYSEYVQRQFVPLLLLLLEVEFSIEPVDFLRKSNPIFLSAVCGFMDNPTNIGETDRYGKLQRSTSTSSQVLGGEKITHTVRLVQTSCRSRPFIGCRGLPIRPFVPPFTHKARHHLSRLSMLMACRGKLFRSVTCAIE